MHLIFLLKFWQSHLGGGLLLCEVCRTLDVERNKHGSSRVQATQATDAHTLHRTYASSCAKLVEPAVQTTPVSFAHPGTQSHCKVHQYFNSEFCLFLSRRADICTESPFPAPTLFPFRKRTRQRYKISRKSTQVNLRY